jgi:hypothetical protein
MEQCDASFPELRTFVPRPLTARHGNAGMVVQRVG